MGERYIKVFSGSENLYTDNAPVVIRASALLKDTETGKMIAQLKLQNISGKSISYVKVVITQLDSVRNPLDKTIDFEYLDLSIADKEEFGSKKPIFLPNSSSRSFNVGVSHIGFIDGTVWTSENTNWQSAEENSATAQIVAAEDTYKKAVALSKSINKVDVQNAKQLFESISTVKDVKIEIDLCNERIKEFDNKESSKLQKKKKARTISLILAGGVVLLALIGYFVVYPFISVMVGDYYVYINMYNVKEFDVPEGEYAIYGQSFYDCDSLVSVTIPEGVEWIGGSAFQYCDNLTSVTIPNSVTEIGEWAFCGCNNLTDITIGSGVIRIGRSAFNGCSNLKNIVLPEGLQAISEDAFIGCSKLEGITIPNSVTRLEGNSFRFCTSLTEITIPDSINYIGSCMFYGCENLKSVTLPKTIVSIYGNAFCDCTNLKTIIFEGTTNQWKSISKDYDWDSNTGNYIVICTDGTIPK